MNDTHLDPPAASAGTKTVRKALREKTDTVDLEVEQNRYAVAPSTEIVSIPNGSSSVVLR
jgi:hypothetical protein